MLNRNIEICSGIILLKNGSTTQAKNPIQTSLTCSFDSIYFVVAAMYADFINVKNQIDQLATTCVFSKMVTTMFQAFGSNTLKLNSLHRQRNEILHALFEDRKLQYDSGLIFIKCHANVNYVIPRVLPKNLYSYTRTKQCDRCDRNFSSPRCFIDINFEEFQELSVKNLNTCLLNSLLHEKSSKCQCGGILDFAGVNFSNFIIIDLHLETTIEEITLNEIPKMLDILGVKFALTACIEFIGEMPKTLDPKKESVAHYVSHILRSNNQWQTFDDLKSQTFPSKTNSKLKGQVVFYVKIN